MRAKNKTPQEWSAIVSGQKQSGLNNKAYAEMIGVNVCSLVAWKRRFKKETNDTQAPLVEVSIPVQNGALSLRFPNGIELQIPLSLGNTQILTFLNWAVRQ